jgi:hypothetical protein
MIIDFRIEKQSHGYSKQDILEKFIEGNSEYNWTGLMTVAVNCSRDEKLEIMKKSLKEWDLVKNINDTQDVVKNLILKAGDTMKFDDDLEQYVKGIKSTIETLLCSSC